MSILNYEWISSTTCNVLTPCLSPIGQIYQEVDGYFVFGPVQNGGAWSSYLLHEIARKLDELNGEKI